jgi:SOS-response transcriptional repressor LexA
MEEKPVTSTELHLLRVVAHYLRANGTPPTTQWLAKELCVTPSGISNHKHNLREKGYLSEKSKDAMLTEKAWQLLGGLYIATPTQIRVLGQVKAGRARQDEVSVDLRYESHLSALSFSFTDADVPLLIVPAAEGISTVFALEVIGESMEYEHIFEGDYVIVQGFTENDMPKQGELIVTYYVPAYYEEDIDIEQATGGGDVLDDYLEGPTVKYYYEKEAGFYRLGWRKGFNESPHTVRAVYVRPIGRVIGVYRALQQSLKATSRFTIIHNSALLY